MPKRKVATTKTKKNDEHISATEEAGASEPKKRSPEPDEAVAEIEPSVKTTKAPKAVKTEKKSAEDVVEKKNLRTRVNRKDLAEPEEDELEVKPKKSASKKKTAPKETSADEKNVTSTSDNKEKGDSKPKKKGKLTKRAQNGAATKSESEPEPEPEPDTKTKKSKKPQPADFEESETSEKKKKSSKSSKKEEKEEPDNKPKEKASRTKSKAKEAETEEKPSEVALKNQSGTVWEKIDFNCKQSNSEGKKSNLHITSWNVSGLRAWLKKDGLSLIKYDKPDVFCLQEIKCSEEQLPDEVKKIPGYTAFWGVSKTKGYAGVAIFSKTKPVEVKYGIDDETFDDEGGRCITAEFKSFYLVNVYVPNAGRKLVTLPKRLAWNVVFKDYINKLDEHKPVIICGDMNVAHNEIDLKNPKTNTKNAGFTPEEREGMTDFLEEGYVDTFRKLYPDKEAAYTFWSYMGSARSKNVGWRLDYFIVSERLAGKVCDNVIQDKVFGSDHCPISLFINV